MKNFMKKMKKLVPLFFVLLLAFTMTACGGSTDPKEVYKNAVEKNKQLTSADLHSMVKIEFQMNESGTETSDGESSSTEAVSDSSSNQTNSITMDMKGKIQNINQDDIKMAMDYTTGMAGISISGKIYYTDGYCYTDMANQKTKVALDFEKLKKQIGGINIQYIAEETIQDISMEKNGSDQIIHFKADGSKLTDYVTNILGTLDELNENTDILFQEVTGTLTVNSEGYITAQTVHIVLTSKTEEGSVILDTESTYNNPGQEVTVELPDLSGYTEQELPDETSSSETPSLK